MTLLLPDITRNAYKEYLAYLRAGGKRIRLDENIHDPSKSIGKVHASAIGRCPKKTALSRQADTASFDVELFDFSTQHLMEQGKRDAEPIQEAFVHAYPIESEPEWSIERNPFRGRVDVRYLESILELKRRDGYKDKTGLEHSPTPYLTDLYQMICYSYMTGYDDIWLGLVTRFNLYFYRLVSDIGGFVLLHENGERWRSEFNNPSYLNYDIVMAQATVHQQYLNGERSDDPLPFYLNYKGYECGKWHNGVKPKLYKYPINGKNHNDAFFVPTCPFFAECKGTTLNADGMVKIKEVEYDSKKFSVAQP